MDDKTILNFVATKEFIGWLLLFGLTVLMDRIETFCPECRKDVSCNIAEVMLRDTLKGEVYEYKGLEATCPDCESEVYIAKIEDYNLKVLYDSYREKNSIISLEKIQELPDKYGIRGVMKWIL